MAKEEVGGMELLITEEIGWARSLVRASFFLYFCMKWCVIGRYHRSIAL